VGILTVPYALASGGWLSLILLFAIATSTFYTGLLIQRCMDADPTIRSYPDIGDRAFGNIGRILVSISTNLELYLVATGFLILGSDNLSNLFPEMEFDIYGTRIGARTGFLVLIAILILPTSWLNNMSLLSYISASGVLASLIILGSILWAGAFDGIGFKETGKLVNWKGIPSAISLYAFCYCAHPDFPTLYTSMKNQLTYSSMAVIGYLMFGSKVESQITLSLPTNKISSRVAISTTLVTPIAKYALMLTPLVNAVESWLQSYYKKRKCGFLIRTILMISTVAVALFLPFFGDLMSLVGALLSATVSITIPCLCYLKISGAYRRIGLEMVIIGLIVLVGLMIALVGTYISFIGITESQITLSLPTNKISSGGVAIWTTLLAPISKYTLMLTPIVEAIEARFQSCYNTRKLALLVGNGDLGRKEEEDEYTSPTASFFSTCFNCLNALSGVGILSVPYALASGGWLSLILLFAIASSTFYTGLLIQRCMDADPTIRSYPDIGDRAFGNVGRILVSISMNVELYLVATGFLILGGDNLSNLFPEMEFDIYGTRIGAQTGFLVLIAIVILPTSWLNNMSLLSYISASGVLASLIILGSILWAGSFDGIGFQERGKLVNWKGIPSAISLYAFCYGAHPVFPTLYTSMKNQLTYSSMAVIGYLMFGSEVESQITLSLPTDKISSRVAISTTLVTPIAKYALMLTPTVNAIESWLQSYYKKRKCGFLIRTILMISTVAVALFLPFFGDLMSLVGALLSATVSITIPCLCYLKISGAYRRIGLEMVIIGLIVLVGLMIALVGTYISFIGIVRRL
ncbi:Amino acid transporter, transmembrane, partial [Cynara cardunculus var. scolymus]